MKTPGFAAEAAGQAPQRALAERSWRYSLVAVLCLLLNYLVILGVDWLGAHYLIAMTAAFVAVTPIAFFLHSHFTFREPLRWGAFRRFTAVVASAAPMAFLAMIILCSGFGLHVAIATPIATIAVFLWNFVAVHWAIVPRFSLRSIFSGRASANAPGSSASNGEI